MSYTKRSWHYQTNADAYTHIVRDEKNNFICSTPQGTDGEDRANAKLIAAAPDMLEALKWVLKEGYANETLDCGDHCSNACIWCAVRNAIEKAEGREP